MIRRKVTSLIENLTRFKWTHIATFLLLLVVSGILVELNANASWYPMPKQFLVPLAIIAATTTALIAVIAALIRRLLSVVKYGDSAQPADLLLIGFIYTYSIGTFGVMFRALDTLLAQNVFCIQSSVGIRLFDAFYLCGVTIATVGYGDATPTHWITRFLAVVQALLGLALTAIVAGFFIGSLLSRGHLERQARWFGGLQRKYVEALEKFPAAISSMANYNDDNYKTLQRKLLQDIASLVTLQYEPAPSAKVTANWMQLYAGSDAPNGDLDLARPYTHPMLRTQDRMRTLWGILVMREWSEKPETMPGPNEFALPVYDPNDLDQNRNQLTGAPEAITNEAGCVVIPDTNDIDLGNQDDSVKQALVEYFQHRAADIRSFASIRIEYAGKVLGVINVQSNEPELCGGTPEVQRIIVDMVRPFARYLASAIVNWTKRR